MVIEVSFHFQTEPPGQAKEDTELCEDVPLAHELVNGQLQDPDESLQPQMFFIDVGKEVSRFGHQLENGDLNQFCFIIG